MEFLDIPDKYYDNLRERLKTAKITVKEDISEVSLILSCDDIMYVAMVLTEHEEHILLFSHCFHLHLLVENI